MHAAQTPRRAAKLARGSARRIGGAVPLIVAFALLNLSVTAEPGAAPTAAIDRGGSLNNNTNHSFTVGSGRAEGNTGWDVAARRNGNVGRSWFAASRPQDRARDRDH